MADYIDKELQCKDRLRGKKFYYKNITSQWCPGCKDRNLDPIYNNSDGLSDADKESDEPRRPPDPNRERFTQVPNNAEFRDLTEPTISILI